MQYSTLKIESNNALTFIDSSRNVYAIIRDKTSKLVAKVLVFTIGLPLLSYVLNKSYKFIKREIEEESLVMNDAADYKRIRIHYDDLYEAVKRFNSVDEWRNDLTSPNFLRRKLAKHIEKIYGLLVTQKDKVQSVIATLDKGIEENHQFFRQIPEEELWANRPREYDYIL